MDRLFKGDDECIEEKIGSHKEILLLLLKDTDFEVLISPVLSKSDLKIFIDKYDGDKNGEFTKEELIEMYVSGNPNW